MTVTSAVIASLLITAIIFCERLFPFAVFSIKKPGKLIHFFERYIPPVIMLGLLIYSFRDTRFTELKLWVPQFTAIIFTIITYLWKKNSLISIFGATVIYMILIRIM